MSPVASFNFLVNKQGYEVILIRGDIQLPVKMAPGKQSPKSGIDEAVQNNYTYKVQKSALDAVGFPGSPRKGDKIQDDIENTVVNIVRARSVIINGVVIGYDITARG